MPSKFRELAEKYPESYPENLGKPWSEGDIIEILQCIRDKKSHKEIAEKLKRTVGGINARLRLLAWEYHCENKTMEQIQKYTGLTKDEIVDSITRHQYKETVKEKKKEQKKTNNNENKPAQTTLPVQIIDTKSLNDVYLMLQELSRDIKEIKAHLGLVD